MVGSYRGRCGVHDVREVGAVSQLVGLLAQEERLARARPVVREARDLPPARPRELEPDRLNRRDALRLPVVGPAKPTSASGRGSIVVSKSIVPPGFVTRLSIAEQRQVVDRVVEDAEEEDEVERLQLEELLAPSRRSP